VASNPSHCFYYNFAVSVCSGKSVLLPFCYHLFFSRFLIAALRA
jgi:hypothetical protein